MRWSISLAIGIAALGIAYKTFRRKKRIPGPTIYPIIGNLPLIWPFLKTRRLDLLHYQLFKDYGNIVLTKILGQNNMVTIRDAEAAKFVLTSSKFIRPDHFARISDGLLNHALFALESSPEWYRHRKLLQPAFGPSHLKYAAQISDQKIMEAVSYWNSLADADGCSFIVNFTDDISLVTLEVLSIVAFGQDSQSLNKRVTNTETEKYGEIVHTIFEIVMKRIPIPSWLWNHYGIGKNSKEIRDLMDPLHLKLHGIIDKAKNTAVAPDDKSWNLIDRLLYAADKAGDRFADQEIVGETLGFITAGLETTANTVTWAIIELSRHPKVVEKIRKEFSELKGNQELDFISLLPKLKYLDMVVKEVQRMHSIVFILRRRTLEEVRILGYDIPAGTDMGISICGIHMNPEYWPEPEIFNPDRFLKTPAPGTFLPFGDGPHLCIGFKMALIETKILLLRILEAFDVEIVSEIVPETLITIKPHGDLGVKFKTRK